MATLLPLPAARAIIIAAAKPARTAANRLGQPAVTGELAVGLLGPSILGLFDSAYFASAPGVICLMFAAGPKVEFDDFPRAGRPAPAQTRLGFA